MYTMSPDEPRRMYAELVQTRGRERLAWHAHRAQRSSTPSAPARTSLRVLVHRLVSTWPLPRTARA